MADVRPFAGLRFDPLRVGDLGRILCPPYDVMNADDERRYRQHDARNAVRLELSAATVAAGPEDRYERAAATLREWRGDGTLTRDRSPCYYLHEASFAHGGATLVRRELIAAVGLEPWERRVVLPHERTYDRPKADRLRLLEATRTNISPILSFFQREPDGEDALGAAWSWAGRTPPLAEGTDLGGVGHRLWALADPPILADLRRFFADRPLFVADGHHRYETALRYREQLGGALPAAHPANYVLMHLIAQDDPGLVILPIHRLLRGLDGLDAAELEERLAVEFHFEYFPLWPDAPSEQVDAYVTQLESRGRAEKALGIYGPDPTIFGLLSPRNRNALPASIPLDRDPSWRELDVVLADAAVIRPLLAERGLAAEDAIDYTRDAHEAFALVRGGRRQLAVLLNATRVDQVAAVALAGERMPEKSTYFYPKAPTGLVFHPLD
jgi:uncharacterized protein (DUF1015 family)